MENNKTPSIRFKGFTDPWEQRKLGDISSLITKGTTPKDKSGDGEINFIKVENIDDSSGEITGMSKISLEEHQGYLKRSQLQEDDILFSIAGTLGRVTSVSKGILPANTNQALSIIRLKEGNLEYVKTCLKGNVVDDFIRRNPTVGAQPNLSLEQVSSLEISMPSKDEQDKIGAYFRHLDNLITLHQRKYDKLLNIKKSMLEKMFPKNGSNIPEIRFKGFTDPWEQRKLLDCIEKITDFRGRTPKKLGMDWSESGYLALSALNVKDGYIDFTQDVHYGNQELYDKWMTGNELHKGQVLFTTEAPMGNVAQVPDNRRYILSQRTIAFGVKEDLITENFLATILRSPNVIATLTALSSGGTAKGVSQKSLSTVEIIIPNDLGEQERLANTFLELDHLITLHQRELEKFQNIKKSMLEKMFL